MTETAAVYTGKNLNPFAAPERSPVADTDKDH